MDPQPNATPSKPPKAARKKFNALVLQARDAEAAQEWPKALGSYEAALQIFEQDKLSKKIGRLRALVEAESCSNSKDRCSGSPDIPVEIHVESLAGLDSRVDNEEAGSPHLTSETATALPGLPVTSGSSGDVGVATKLQSVECIATNTTVGSEPPIAGLCDAPAIRRPDALASGDACDDHTKARAAISADGDQIDQANATHPSPAVLPLNSSSPILRAHPSVSKSEDDCPLPSPIRLAARADSVLSSDPDGSIACKASSIDTPTDFASVPEDPGVCHSSPTTTTEPLKDGWTLRHSTGQATLPGGFSILIETYNKLFDHQREGIKWFWGFHGSVRVGGILGDDMGMGKTVQVATFLRGVLGGGCLAQTALIVLPVSLIGNWQRELERWAPDVAVRCFHGSSKPKRNAAAAFIRRQGGILLTSYGLVTSATKDLNGSLSAFAWDYVFLDEGHKIKNNSRAVSKRCRDVNAKRRFILTGTPVQNSLEELWSLVDFTCFGKLLGSQSQFKEAFAGPIVSGTLKDATDSETLCGAEAAQRLRDLISPVFLRREKQSSSANPTHSASQGGSSVESEKATPVSDGQDMPEKLELVCWVKLAPKQRDMYRKYLESEDVQDLLNSTRSPLAALTVLKKICDHPTLLQNYRAFADILSLGSEGSPVEASPKGSAPSIAEPERAPPALTPARSLVRQQRPSLTDDVTALQSESWDALSDKIVEESGKLQFTLELLQRLHKEKRRVLLFSQSKKMLSVICNLVGEYFDYLRLDGDVSDPAERSRLVDEFNGNSKYFAFFLTTQVGGVGLTLTGADRVIIYDPNWNPSTDAQAIDRAYRIGQTKTVLVYRLVSCGTVEEKIYRKQVYKNGLSRAVTKNTSKRQGVAGYFTRNEITALFQLENDGAVSATQQQLAKKHKARTIDDPELAAHARFLESLSIYGLSDHSRLFTTDGEIIELDSDDESEQFTPTDSVPGTSSRRDSPDEDVVHLSLDEPCSESTEIPDHDALASAIHEQSPTESRHYDSIKTTPSGSFEKHKNIQNDGADERLADSFGSHEVTMLEFIDDGQVFADPFRATLLDDLRGPEADKNVQVDAFEVITTDDFRGSIADDHCDTHEKPTLSTLDGEKSASPKLPSSPNADTEMPIEAPVESSCEIAAEDELGKNRCNALNESSCSHSFIMKDESFSPSPSEPIQVDDVDEKCSSPEVVSSNAKTDHNSLIEEELKEAAIDSDDSFYDAIGDDNWPSPPTLPIRVNGQLFDSPVAYICSPSAPPRTVYRTPAGMRPLMASATPSLPKETPLSQYERRCHESGRDRDDHLQSAGKCYLAADVSGSLADLLSYLESDTSDLEQVDLDTVNACCMAVASELGVWEE